MLFLLAVTLALPSLRGQEPSAPEPVPQTPEASEASTVTLFPHAVKSRYLVLGQANIIFQSHPGFHSPYEGDNSFLGRGEYKT